ncbi:MAG: malate dehydrogenase [Bacteroidota bacterium]
MAKVTVVGAGNVGATCAESVARKEIAREVVLLDLKEGFSEGKALDMLQMGSIEGYSTRLMGSTNDYSKTKDSDVVVITSGSPRKPGMSRDDLITTNAKIMKAVAEQVIEHSPNAIIIVVANPLDTLTYQALKITGFPKERVVGMAGILDTARYRAFISLETGVSQKDIQALLMGGHGDTMVPLPRFTTITGIPVTNFIKPERLNEIVERTKKGGGELTKLIGTSAWYAPGNAAAQMVEAILKDEHRVLPCCALLEGEYGLKDICVGVPVVLSRKGIEQVIELDLNDDEKKLLHESAEAVRKNNELLSTI